MSNLCVDIMSRFKGSFSEVVFCSKISKFRGKNVFEKLKK